MNRIEGRFAALKKFALDNADYRRHAQQQAALESYLTWRNRTRALSRQSWKAYRRTPKQVA